MATLTVEGIPDALVARLARAAAGNGRCLNSEVIVRLAQAAAGGQARDGCRPECGCRCQGRCRTVPVGWGGPPAALHPV